MSKQSFADQAERQTILTELDQNFFVEAGAGSGKTTSLVGRIIALIKTGTCSIAEIAAITFTRKAAGELKERLQIEIEQSLGDAADRQVTERLQTAINQLDQCYVGTIHSFCFTILRERPVEAGLDPAFQSIEGVEERLLERKAWDNFIQDQYLYQRQNIDELAQIDIDPRDLFDAYRTLNLYPDVNKAKTSAPYPAIGDELQRMLAFAHDARLNMPSTEPDKGWDDLQNKIRKILSWNRIFNLNDHITFFRLLSALETPKAKVTQNRWLDGPQAKQVLAAYEALHEGYLKPLLQRWREYRYPILIKFLEAASEYYRELRNAENCLNFQDLLMDCAILLRDNAEVRAYFQQRFPRLLIDEFQDTDPIQAEIMMYLSGGDCSEKDWTRLRPRPGALFVVGDPKQSIYRFRRADIDTFQQVKAQMVAAGGQVLKLTTNFRSNPALIKWVNDSFAEIFAVFDQPFQADYEAMNSAQEFNPKAGPLQVITLPDGGGDTADQAWEDARQVSAWIKTVINDGIEIGSKDDWKRKTLAPKDFLVLMHYKKDMLLYAQALQEAGLPYTISGGSDLSNSYVVEELLYLLQAIADPGNPVALVNCLRGLYFGLSDQELYEFKQAGGRFSFLSRVPDEQKLAGHQRWQTVFSALRDYYRWSNTQSPSTALHNIVEQIGLMPFSLTLELGYSHAAAVLQLLEIVRQMESKGITRFADVVDFIQTLFDESPEDAIDIEGGRQPGVRIMNLHKAKGLEAAVVLLANPLRQKQHTPDYHVSRNVVQSEGYFTITHKKSEFTSQTLAQPPGWQGYCDNESLYQQAERQRLLYVASTRAKDLLVICTNSKKPEKSPWNTLENFLEPGQMVNVDLTVLEDSVLKQQDITPDSLEQLIEAINEPWSNLINPSYAKQTITEAVKSGQNAPQRQATGKGTSWGNVIHKALERLMTDPAAIEQTPWLIELLESEGRKGEEQAELQIQLQAVMRQPLWQRAKSAQIILTEVPFGLLEGNKYVTGAIDLIFREAQGWVIVDYKSDSSIDENHRLELESYYQPQVEAYKEYWEKVTGEKVTETVVIFADIKEGGG